VSEAYAVPKRSVEADLKLLHQEPQAVLLHLADRAARHSGPELPSDLLNADGTFFPVTLPGGGEVRFVHRGSVVWAEVEAADEEGAEGGGPLVGPADPDAAEASVLVLFEDGSRAAGKIRWTLPEGRRRLRDFLDAADRFFPLGTGSRIRLVNRECVSVIELG